MKLDRRTKPSIAYTSATLLLIGLGPLLRPLLDDLLRGGMPPDAWWALLLGAWALCAVLDLARHLTPRLVWMPAAALAWWLGMETFAASHLVGPLQLRHYAVIRNVDHRPSPFARGTNVDGLRGTPAPEVFQQPGFNLLFLGDSYTWGFRVDAEEAFPAVAANLLRARFPDQELRMANLGWTSSSPLLSWRRLVEIGDSYRPQLVVLAIDMTDFGDDIRWGRMLERRGLYRIYDRIPIALRLFEACTGQLLRRLVVASAGGGPVERYFVCEQPLDESRPWIQVLVQNVDRIESWCGERGVDFALVLLPRPHQYDERECPQNWERSSYTTLGPYSLEPFHYFEELRQRVGYPIVSLLDDFLERASFPTCFEDDPHWNPAGHRVAARGIARALEPLIAARIEQAARDSEALPADAR